MLLGVTASCAEEDSVDAVAASFEVDPSNLPLEPCVDSPPSGSVSFGGLAAAEALTSQGLAAVTDCSACFATQLWFAGYWDHSVVAVVVAALVEHPAEQMPVAVVVVGSSLEASEERFGSWQEALEASGHPKPVPVDPAAVESVPFAVVLVAVAACAGVEAVVECEELVPKLGGSHLTTVA